MEKVGYEKYKEWIDSLLEECTDENRVKGKELEIITRTIPENINNINSRKNRTNYIIIILSIFYSYFFII